MTVPPPPVTSAPTPSPLPANELRAIVDLVGAVMQAARARTPRPDILHHYTTPAGFQGIVQSGMLRASFIGFMNDASEYIHAVQLLLAAVQRERPSATGADRALLDHMEARLAPTEPGNYYPYFITCFSAAENDLSQWRAYGQGEGGFSLGFDYTELAQRVTTIPNSQLAPVVYAPNEQQQLVDDLLSGARREYSRCAGAHAASATQHLQHWVEALFLLASALGPMMKNSAFASEREWRIIHFAADASSIRYLPKSSMLSGYVSLALGQPQAYPTHWSPDAVGRGEPMPPRLPLRVVWVGPGRFNDLSRTAANSLLTNSGYVGIGLQRSAIPFRVVT
jgi:hypothetical protein